MRCLEKVDLGSDACCVQGVQNLCSLEHGCSKGVLCDIEELAVNHEKRTLLGWLIGTQFVGLRHRIDWLICYLHTPQRCTSEGLIQAAGKSSQKYSRTVVGEAY